MAKTAAIITGASRSFGRFLALDFAREVAGGSLDLHLWARHEQDLHETERLAREAWSSRSDAGTLRTFVKAVDLGDARDYSPKADAVLAQLQAESYDAIYLVHNAGSLGELGYSHEWSSHEMLDQYWQFNVHSVLWLDKRFVETFGASREELGGGAVVPGGPQLVLMNITSLCGIQPVATHGLYCIGKAAREMHFAVLAKEQAPAPKVRVLQYSPGPMDTGMQATIRESPAVLPELAHKYGDMKANGTLVRPEVSSRLGVRLAVSGLFTTGAHVDYYDIA
ncbi:hypothetical protein PybrP1_005208 [[Pythium] brassicae (nom. inval.)]|nr:hypothetical protein PybrP1_005208 [[Pythium] brassicae (nom. inval.)]